MSHNKPVSYHSNPYNAQSACQHCEGIICQERWCLTLNPAVHCACEIVLYPDKLTIGDAIILHSLGVAWSKCALLERPIKPDAELLAGSNAFPGFEDFRWPRRPLVDMVSDD